MISSDLFSNDLNQHPLPLAPVKLPVKDLLPGAKIQPAVGHRHHHLSTHDLPLQVRVRIVLAGTVVPILVDRRVRRELLQPDLVVVVKATSSSLMNTLAVMCIAFTTFNAFLVAYHIHTPQH
jgi:hypothetical protein